MRLLMIMILLSLGLFSNTQPYKKEILLEPVAKASLVRVALDNAFYAHTKANYRDVRLLSSKGIEEGYFIRSLKEKRLLNYQTLKATLYNRTEGTLVYSFKEPFTIEELELHIEDRNFESLVDVYADGKPIAEKVKIFDYSNETGMQNFNIKIPQTVAKEIKLVYHLDETTSFYKKYQHLREMSQYLTIKSVTFSNTLKAKELWKRTSIVVEEHSNDEKKRTSSYLFNLNHIPFSKIEFEMLEQNFKRSGQLFFSENGEQWQLIDTIELSSSTLGREIHKVIEQEGRTGYLKLLLVNGDNQPLNIKGLTLISRPNYLYFLANPSESYKLYFGDKQLTEPFYELESLVGSSAVAIEGKLGKLEILKVDKNELKISFLEEHKEVFFMLFILLALLIMGYVAFGLLKRSEERGES